MCNLYKMTSTVDEMKRLFGDFAGDRNNLQAFDDIYSNTSAPVLRSIGNSLALESMTWGVPAWKPGMRPITNVRNLTSSFWKSMLSKPDNRCLVPITEFCEWTGEKGSKRKVWFGLKDEPLFSFAGVWRQSDDGLRCAFLTCEPNELVAPIHPKSMPVILAEDDYDTWLTADYQTVYALATPYPAQLMRVE